MAPSPLRVRVSGYVRAIVDAFTYALVLTTIAVIGSGVASIATGGGAVRANLFLFLTGWGLMGYATFRLWPTSPADEEADAEMPALQVDHQTRFQRIVRATPPVRWVRLPPPEDRIPLPVQLFVGSVVILVTSFLIEAVLRVG